MAKQTDRGLENREIILGVLTEVLEKGSFVHLILNQALYKYQYLDKADRAFITRVTEGTLEYMLQIDAVIDRYSKTKTKRMKPLIRSILRMSVTGRTRRRAYTAGGPALERGRRPADTRRRPERSVWILFGQGST